MTASRSGGVPAVLASPPWGTKERRSAPIFIEELPTVAFEARVHLSDQEREDALEPCRKRSNPPDESRLEEAYIPMYLIHAFDDASALALWNETDPDRWCYSMQRDVLAILARFGEAATEGLVRYASRDPQFGFPALMKLESPRVAPLLSLWAAKSTALGSWGKQWLLAYPRAATVGLVPIALGPLCPQRAAAESALRLLAHHHPEDTLDAVAPFGKAAIDAIDVLLSADPLLAYPDPMPKLPAWWKGASVTKPRLLDGTELSDQEVETLALMVRFSPVDPPYVGLEEVRRACEPGSLDAFAWDLASLWIENGGSPAAYWALHGIGHLGGEKSARELAKLIWVWPKQRGLAKAKLGVEVLARMGTDVALMHLDRLARNVRKKELKEHAQEAIREVAQSRGLSAEELGDRLVPTLGLDESKEASELDFGTRTLFVRFDEALRPYAVDETGARAKSVRALKSDDPVKAKAAISRWKGLKKDAESCALHQIRRLERALSNRRRWSSQEFTRLVAHHVLLTYLARALVWGTYDEAGALQSTFRVAEDGTLADVHEEAWSLPMDSPVGLVHPLEIDRDAMEAWRQIFTDYELIQPFLQIERPHFRPSAAEAESDRLDRFAKKEVYSGALLSLDLLGWCKGTIEDGWIRSYVKEVDSRSVYINFYPGLWVTNPMQEQVQVIEAVVLRPSRPLGELHPIVFSEIVLTLERLIA